MTDRHSGNQKWIGRGSESVPPRRTDAEACEVVRVFLIWGEGGENSHTYLPHTSNQAYGAGRQPPLGLSIIYATGTVVQASWLVEDVDNSQSRAVHALMIATPTVASTRELVSEAILPFSDYCPLLWRKTLFRQCYRKTRLLLVSPATGYSHGCNASSTCYHPDISASHLQNLLKSHGICCLREVSHTLRPRFHKTVQWIFRSAFHAICTCNLCEINVWFTKAAATVITQSATGSAY